MKKLFILLVLAVSTMTASAQFLQAKKGAKGNAAVASDIRTGFRFGIETGVGFGDYTSVAFDFTPGAQINKYIYVGGGTGLEVLTAASGLQIPIFAEVKGFLPLKGIAKPYIGMRGGYAIGATNASDAGLLNIGAGVELWDHFNFSIGYAGRFYSIDYGSWGSESITSSNGFIKIGYRF